jgi:hypothetical protein
LRAAAGLAVEDLAPELPEGAVVTPVPWDDRALIATPATTTAPMPERMFRIR